VAELANESTFELDGLLFDSPVFCVMAPVDGLGSARVEADVQSRQGDGQVHPRYRLADRAITMRIGLTDPALSDKEALEAAMAPPVDRKTPKLLRWRLPNEVTKRTLVQPAQGVPLEWPGDEKALVYNQPEATLHLIAHDPVLYEDALTSVAFSVSGGGSDGFTATNDGALPATSPGRPELGTMAWTLTVSGSCTNPYLRHTDVDETWKVLGSFGGGDVITVGYDRVTRVEGQVVTASVRGPGTCPVPLWPVLRPGANDLEVGCDSGGFSGTFSYRSTW
jgi:hypothetical protein